MALSKELQLQQGYQSPIERQGFNPLQLTDQTDQLERNKQVELSNIKAEGDALNETAKLQDLANRLNLEEGSRMVQFSETLGKVVQAGVEMYAEAGMERGMNKALEAGATFEEWQEYTETLNRAKLGDAAMQITANDALAKGEPFEVANLYKKLGHYEKIGFTRAMAKQAGDAYKPWLEDQLQNNNTLQIRLKDGTVFTPSEAKGDPVRTAQAVRALNSEFYKQYGLVGVNTTLLNEHAFPSMRKARTDVIGEARFEFAQNESFKTRELADAELLVDNDPLAWVRRMSATVDARGNHLGLRGAWSEFWKHLGNLDKAGELSLERYNNIKNTVDPESGTAVGERWATQFLAFDKERAANVRANFAADEADREMLAKQGEQQLEAYFRDNPDEATEANIKGAQQQYFDKYGKESSYLKQLESTYGIDAKAEQELNDRFEKLAEQNLLTTEMVAQAPWKTQTKWMDAAKKQEASRSTTGQFKTQLKAIENHVKTNPSVKVSPDGSASGMATLVIGELQAKFNRKVSEYVATGELNAAQAANQAVTEVMAEFDAGGRYAIDKNGNFSSFSLGNAKTSAAINGKLKKINDSFLGGGKASLNKKPGLIFNAAELTAIEDGYGEPGWKIPFEAQYWGSKLGITGLEVINRQRDAAGMRPLAVPQSLEIANTTMSTQMQSLLNRLPTYNRSVRALSSMGSFQPAVVPKGFGSTIQKAAAANGIDPAILTGILEVESSWRDDIIYGRTRSSAGARGIAQIMPEYHPGVNYDDPVASINYAAKHLKGLIAATGGDVNRAIQAYNSGLGGIGKSQENRDYLPKVLKSAAKYGYGQAWRDPATMRPSVVYKIGSLGYGSTGPHLDLKRVARGTTATTSSVEIKPNEVDNFVEVNVNGKWKALSKGTTLTDTEARHRARGSYGVDYAAPSGTPVRLKNGAQVVGSFKGQEGTDHLIIELPDGRRFQFLHGTKV
jgi:hypothetical protein